MAELQNLVQPCRIVQEPTGLNWGLGHIVIIYVVRVHRIWMLIRNL